MVGGGGDFCELMNNSSNLSCTSIFQQEKNVKNVCHIFEVIQHAWTRAHMRTHTYTYITLISLFCDQPNVVSETWSPWTSGCKCDNVLFSQSCCILQEVVIDDYGAMVELWLAEENQRISEKPAPVSPLPPRTSCEVTWKWTQGSAV
jgi:hypothetical protein